MILYEERIFLQHCDGLSPLKVCCKDNIFFIKKSFFVIFSLFFQHFLKYYSTNIFFTITLSSSKVILAK